MSTLPKRIHERITAAPDGCWNWTGAISNCGYGSVKCGGRAHSTHRLVYSILVGPVPEGLQLDHLCRNRACCNPDHLEPVTHRENQLRGDTFAARNVAKTHCPQGHAYDSANTYTHPSGRRRCRACARSHAENTAARQGRSNRDVKAIRTALMTAGYDVPARGRLSAELMEAYRSLSGALRAA